ncbi:MAG: AAA family ATPase [bacterium]
MTDISKLLQQTQKKLNQIILGKPNQVLLAMCSILARGHLLIEDLPGVGKSTLSHAIAKVFGLEFQRVQFTSDMLPADLLGVSTYNQNDSQFIFHPGPIFTHLLLADEINRASPRTQSALLEAMSEHQVSIEGETRLLPDPFFVIATQNPRESAGTFPLPDSQLDRFMLNISLGYPSHDEERALLQGIRRKILIEDTPAIMDRSSLLIAQQMVDAIHASDAILDYLQLLVSKTRDRSLFQHGLSPRASLGLLQATRAWAFLEGRDYCIPEDLQAIFVAATRHRLIASHDPEQTTNQLQTLLEQMSV